MLSMAALTRYLLRPAERTGGRKNELKLGQGLGWPGRETIAT